MPLLITRVRITEAPIFTEFFAMVEWGKYKKAPNSKRRFRKKVNRYNAKLHCGEWSEAEYMSHILPAYAFASKADSAGFVNKVLFKLPNTKTEAGS
jgi:hypothetical protein